MLEPVDEATLLRLKIIPDNPPAPTYNRTWAWIRDRKEMLLMRLMQAGLLGTGIYFSIRRNLSVAIPLFTISAAFVYYELSKYWNCYRNCRC
jgi:hypothetical protein